MRAALVDQPDARTGVAKAVLEWWSANARDLPWRDTRDPWLVLVSEIMSQQTQVDRVVPKWEAFVTRYPTAKSAAAVPAGELISMWDGLGYNRRALLLHTCAVSIVQHHDGRVPDDLDDLLALAGIGPYTARAVLAFAFEHDVGVLDTNVGRVLARLGGRSLRPVDAQAMADDFVPVGRGWMWNQALLDFGAQLCLKRSPRCSTCPVANLCAWKGVGPDPALGSAAVGRGQSKFAGSDREGRGKLVTHLRGGPAPLSRVGHIMGFVDDPDRRDRVLASLVADGLVLLDGKSARLP